MGERPRAYNADFIPSSRHIEPFIAPLASSKPTWFFPIPQQGPSIETVMYANTSFRWTNRKTNDTDVGTNIWFVLHRLDGDNIQMCGKKTSWSQSVLLSIANYASSDQSSLRSGKPSLNSLASFTLWNTICLLSLLRIFWKPLIWEFSIKHYRFTVYFSKGLVWMVSQLTTAIWPSQKDKLAFT